MKIILSNPKLFIRKALILFVATVALAPLIRYKLYIPAIAYVGGLLILHVFFFILWFYHVPWKEIRRDRKGFILRLISMIFLIYLLTVLKLEGDTITVLIRIGEVFIIHLLILLFLMVIKVDFKGSQLKS